MLFSNVVAGMPGELGPGWLLKTGIKQAGYKKGQSFLIVWWVKFITLVRHMTHNLLSLW
jgi:hypothetical protein